MPYIPFIGLEVHAEVKTKSKMFCDCPSEFFGKPPNTLTCPVCLGFPGSLPVINQGALEKSLTVALALGCEIQIFSKFDRKNYFYPDLPKGYQISQYDLPLGQGGYLEYFSARGEASRVLIQRVHLEEDTAKLLHEGRLAPHEKDKTLIDFNRSGVPLLEIVTEPHQFSPPSAKEFLQKLKEVLVSLEVSDCDMEKGSLRLEANISLSKDRKLPDYKVEIKNINSFAFLEQALSFEIERQSRLLGKGQKVLQETRGFDEKKRQTYEQRWKEEASDYRYFPDPDLPPLRFTRTYIDTLRKNLPKLPEMVVSDLEAKYRLRRSDAQIIVREGLAELFMEVVGMGALPQKVANLLVNKLGLRNKSAREIYGEAEKSYRGGKEEIFKVVEKILLDNQGAVADYREGKSQALFFLLGRVRRRLPTSDPTLIKEVLEEKLTEKSWI